jgi:membrane-associated HD superfamily phosphohydrolase
MLTTFESSDKGDKCKLICVTNICVSIIVAPFIVCCLYYGYQDKDHPCQEGQRASMYLYQWVIGTGYYTLASMVLYWVVISISIWFENPAIVIIFILQRLFIFAWAVIGIVIVSTNENNKCIAQGVDMAIIAVIWQTLAIIGACCSSNSANDD